MKNKKKRRINCLLFTLSTCFLCFVLQWGCYTFLQQNDARFVSPISEENTLIRLQAVHKIDAPILFIGSSLTERLLPRKKISCVTMSHSSFVYIMEFMQKYYQYKRGTIYILEVNNMFNGRNIELMNRTSQWDFDFFRNSSHFSFASKPTNLLASLVFYSLEHKKYETEDTYRDLPLPLVDMNKIPDISTEQKKEWAHLIEGINILKSYGGRICFVNHPCKITPEYYRQNYKKGCILAKHLGIPVLNYNSSEWVKRLEFSDPTHLDSRRKSTVMYMNTVAKEATFVAVD